MELSIREAKARFTEAAAAAARGERVTVTRYGKPFVELVPARAPAEEDFFARLDRVTTELGLDGLIWNIGCFIKLMLIELFFFRRVFIMKNKNDSVDINCHTVSYASILPHSMAVTNILTGAQIVIRTRTMDACILMGKETSKLTNASYYKFSECKI